MIRSIKIQNFRCFEVIEMTDCAPINLIVGDNGAGKTALFEAMFLALCTDPGVAMKPRQWRGLEGSFAGSPDQIEEALWGGYFYDQDLSKQIVIEMKGGGPESRRLVMGKSEKSAGLMPFNALMESQSQTSMLFDWTNSAGEHYPVEASFSPQGLERKGRIENLPTFNLFSAFQPVSSGEIANAFSALNKRGKANGFIDIITAQYPWIGDIGVETIAGSPVLHASVTGSSVKIPLNDVSGAINRFAAIILSMAIRQNSLVIVDEIENGLYHKHHLSMWKSLLEFSRSMNSQLFLSTHNEEWLKALAKASIGYDDDIAFWRLRREVGVPVIDRFSAEQMRDSVKLGVEVR